MSVRTSRLLGTLTGIGLVLGTGLLVVAVLPRAGASPAIDQPPTGGATSRDDNQVERSVAAAPAAWERPVVDAAGLADRIGVRVTQVAVSGGGGLLDLRVQVFDADKADALHDPANPPALVDAATGVVANSLLMGHSHNDPFKPGVTYYYVFENPGNLIRRGSTVSVLLGDTETDDVPVQ